MTDRIVEPQNVRTMSNPLTQQVSDLMKEYLAKGVEDRMVDIVAETGDDDGHATGDDDGHDVEGGQGGDIEGHHGGDVEGHHGGDVEGHQGGDPGSKSALISVRVPSAQRALEQWRSRSHSSLIAVPSDLADLAPSAAEMIAGE